MDAWRTLRHYLKPVIVAWTALAAVAVHAQPNLALFISPVGDYIGQGQTYVTQDTNAFGVSGSPALITVGAFGYGFSFAGPGGTPLTVGIYTNTSRYPFNGIGPGLDISGDGRGCNAECGSFQINELHTNDAGQVDRLWVTFSNKCECFYPSMTGDIRYRSQLAPPLPSPRVLRVPADYPKIQAGLDAASVLVCDTVLVSPGVYPESLSFWGKTAILTSSGGPAVTFINAPFGSPAITFSHGETTNAVVAGFTITNAGVSVSSSSPTIVSNVLLNCGTAVNNSFGSPVVAYNVISGCSGPGIAIGGAGAAVIQSNVIRANGGGITMNSAGSPTINNNLIQGNAGDGVAMINECDANITQNVIMGNTGNGIVALVPDGARGPYSVNNTIVGNLGAGISSYGFHSGSIIDGNIVSGTPAIWVGTYMGNSPPSVHANDFYSPAGKVFDGGTFTNISQLPGNISANPCFVCLPGGDVHLFAASPCIDAGTNGAPGLPAVDFDGRARVLAGRTNGPAMVDMGAFEFSPVAPPSPCLYINCPSNVVVVAAVGQNSAVVNYPSPDGTPSGTIVCLPPSGALFPGGTNLVSCTLVYGTNTLVGTFTVTVLVPPYITNQPSVLSAVANSNVTFSVSAVGSAPLTYQWYFDGVALADATDHTLTLANVQSKDEGYYRLIMANSVGTATSAPVLLRVLPAKAGIVAEPASVTVSAGSQALLAAVVIGSAPLSIQWYKGGAMLPGANTASWAISNAQAADAGAYQLVVSNPLGSALSPPAALTVLAAKPAFALQPVSTAAVAGTNVTFASLAMGTDDALDPITYAWYFNHTPLVGQGGANLVLSGITATNQGSYVVVATNSLGAVTSSMAQLTVFLPPAFPSGLSNEVVFSGNSIVLGVTATGTAPLGYVWYWNGIQLSNATASLPLTHIQPSQCGYYTITVTNAFGSASSTSRVSVFLSPARVRAWGDDSAGQADVPAALDDAVAIAGGDYHSVALRGDGSVVAWGYDGDGQLEVPATRKRLVSLAAGAAHTLAITEEGAVVAWGRNDAGQASVPSGLAGAMSLAAGDSHSLALLASGGLVMWGDNSYGQTAYVPVLVPPGYWAYVGGQWVWVVPDPPRIQAIAAGRNHNLALMADGTVLGWGDNALGQATAPAGLTNIVAIAAGSWHSVALRGDGTVVAWGDNTFSQTQVPAGLSNVVAIAAGEVHTYARRTDGRIIGWGDDHFGQIDVPADLVNASSVAAGYYHGLALVPVSSNLQASLNGASQLVVRWDGPGVLQSAPSPLGPYVDCISSGNAYTNADMQASARFFRLRK